MSHLLSTISNIVWGPWLIALLVGSGVFLSIKLRFVQIRRLGHSVALIRGKYDNPEDTGDISHFQALCTALSATIGTGNIAGVATAIAAGGPGAVFWMWVTAVFGMALKYSSCLLALKYRFIHRDGSVSGGPMYYLERGLGLRWLGILFAIFAVVASLGIGNMAQANSVSDAIESFLRYYGLLPPAVSVANGFVSIDSDLFLSGIVGLTLAVMVGLVIIGGIKRIARVASRIVPVMCVFYVCGALTILFFNRSGVVPALRLIFCEAFSLKAGVGGLLGSVIRYGVARGVFSNEAGLGSAPIAHAAAKTKEPVREGLVAMVGPLVDTIIVCSMTALVIVTTGMWQSGLNGAALSTRAFEQGLPGLGGIIVAFGLMFFAYSTLISWSYYGDRCSEYLLGGRAISVYRWLYVAVIPVGATMKLTAVWAFCDITNGLMVLPNLIGVLGLSSVVFSATASYFGKGKAVGGSRNSGIGRR
jgi:AGCS family alanine or glycine:cation symporter